MAVNGKTRQWWAGLADDDDNAHVIPVDDLKPHVKTADCPCNPDMEAVENCLNSMFIHHSYDKRELN